MGTTPAGQGAEGHAGADGRHEREEIASGMRRWAVRVIKVATVAVITWGLFHSIGINLGEIDGAELGRLRPALAPLLGSTVALFGAYVGQALVWRRIMTDLGEQPPPLPAALRVYFVSVLGRYVPGRVWQIAGIALLAERAGMSALLAVSAAVLGQIVFLLSGVPFIVALLPEWAGTVPAVAAVGVAMLLLVILHRIGGRGEQTAVSGRFGSLRRRVAPALELAGRIRLSHLLVWAVAYAALWVLTGTAFAGFIAAFAPEAVSRTPFLAGTMVASYLAGYVILIAPAGLGVREGVMGVLLAQVVPAPTAIVLSLLSRIWFTVAELLPLALIPFLRSSGVRASAPAPHSQNST